MRRRNLIIASDSDEEADAAPTAPVPSGGGGGGGSVARPSPRNPSPVPFPFPSSPPPSPPVEISDDEEEVDEIQDPDEDSPFVDFPDEIQDSDGDSPFVDVPEDLSPPPPAPPRHPPPPPPARTTTPTPPPAPAPAPPARTPTETPTPPQTPASAPLFRTPTPTPPPPPPPAPAPTSLAQTRTPTPTPPTAPPARTPTPTPPSFRTPTPTPLPASTPPSALSARLRLVDGFLRRLGLWVRPEWLESCAAGVPGFDTLGGTEAQARRCFEQFLFADMNACGAGVLPEGVGCMDAGVLDGPFVLQVDEIVNMSAPLRERYRDVHAGSKRCLKLSMTDGIQRIYGMEYRPIKDLQVLAPAGFKIVLRNVHIRRGLLMLVPEVTEILGGVVDDLEAAHVRLVSEVNKPPRGKRKQGGLPLSSRASLAAWPGNINVTNGGQEGISLPRTVNPSRPTGLGEASHVGRTAQTVVEERGNPPVVVNGVQERSASHVGRIAQTVVEEHGNPSIVVNGVQVQSQHFQEFTMRDLSTSLTRNNAEASASATYRYEHQQSIRRTTRTSIEEHVDHPIVGNNVHVQEITMRDLSTSLARSSTETSAAAAYRYEPQQSIGRTTRTSVEEYVDHPIVANNVHEQIQHVQEITMLDQATPARTREPSASTPRGYDSQQGPQGIGGTGGNGVEAALSLNVAEEIDQMEHPVILGGENEKPFTYIFNMISDWAVEQDTRPYIQGKIKGLITSVKRFQFKQGYELYIYIDDGSYISEAFVDRDIVQNIIGHSEEEVTAAISDPSSSLAIAMKEIMQGFKRFLVKFEGTMLIEFNRKSSVPVVREMNEGCLSSDAWLLLRRMKTLSAQRHMRSLDFMDTTP